MGRSCCYLAQSCSTFAKNKYPGKSSWCLLHGWKKTTWGRRDGFGIKVSKRAFKQVKGLPKDTLDSLPCQYYPRSLIVVLTLAVGLTASKLLMQNSHMNSTLKKYRILVPVPLSIYLSFFFWLHILGGKQICLNYRIETHPTWVASASYNIIHQALPEERSHVTADAARLNIGMIHADCPAASGMTSPY